MGDNNNNCNNNNNSRGGIMKQNCEDLPPQESFFFPCWEEEENNNNDDDDGDSQSCNWSVQSSSCNEDYGWEEDDVDRMIDQSLSVELDQYLAMSMENYHSINRKRSIRFNENPVSTVHYFEKVSDEDCKNLHYTAHELQKMIDDFVENGSNNYLLSTNIS